MSSATLTASAANNAARRGNALGRRLLIISAWLVFAFFLLLPLFVVATEALKQGVGRLIRTERDRGVLVLSEFAGAAAELKGALLTNPHDPADLAQTCYLALNLPKSEAQARLRELFDIVCFNDIRRWGEDVLAGVAPTEEQPSLTLAS